MWKEIKKPQQFEDFESDLRCKIKYFNLKRDLIWSSQKQLAKSFIAEKNNCKDLKIEKSNSLIHFNENFPPRNVTYFSRRQFSDNHTHRQRAWAQIPQCHEQQKAFVMRNLRPDNRPFLDTYWL